MQTMQWHQQPEHLHSWKESVLSLWPESSSVLAALTSPQQLIPASYRDVILKRWAQGRIGVIGDAAHAMSPQLGQGFGRYAFDMALTSVWSGLLSLFGGVWPDAELWFAYPEPDYFAAYRDRLPACRFDMGANQICFPASQLGRRIQTGDPVMAELMKEKMLRALEARKQQGKADILTLLQPLLVRGPEGYPDMDAVCSKLFMSSRTLKRKLQQAGSGFQVVLDDVRRQDAMRLLANTERSIEDIAAWMGFAEPANFTHAFKRWTGVTPSEWRRNKGR